jgi:hypothetical protein
MISTCPHCKQELGLTESQSQKIQSTLAALESGKKLKFGCPKCKQSIELAPDAEKDVSEGADVSFADSTPEESPQEEAEEFGRPHAPNINWLVEGEIGEKEIIDDVPQLLVMVDNGAMREKIVNIFEKMGYKAEIPKSPSDAIDRMRFVDYDAVVLHADYEGGFENSSVHAHMKSMRMSKRRRIYYILIGPEMHTLYDIQALAYSANLVVNDNEIDNAGLVLKKGLRDYEDLFGPLLAAIEASAQK